MQVKRYRTPTVREALALAREDLGPQALVLSTRMVSAGGVRGWLGRREVELTAMVPTPVSENRPAAPSAGSWYVGAGFSRPEPPPKDANPILDRLAGRGRSRDELIARLQASGLDRRLAREVADALPRLSRREPSGSRLRRTLTDLLTPLAADAEEALGIEVFVGPPGAGKTTTIAKVASQLRAQHGRRASIVAADGFRVGAIEQLRIYAEIIGAPFAVARSAAEFERALGDLRAPILVDTAGRSPGEITSHDIFQVVSRQARVRTHLVMPGATPVRDAERFLDLYAAARPSRVILTKVDETETLSPIVGLLRERGLTISYLGTGQRIPEDLQRATAAALAACVLGEGAPVNCGMRNADCGRNGDSMRKAQSMRNPQSIRNPRSIRNPPSAIRNEVRR